MLETESKTRGSYTPASSSRSSYSSSSSSRFKGRDTAAAHAPTYKPLDAPGIEPPPPFDLDINNYTIEELVIFFKMTDDVNAAAGLSKRLTPGEIAEAVNEFMDQYKTLKNIDDADEAYDDAYITFFKRAQYKLMNHAKIYGAGTPHAHVNDATFQQMYNYDKRHGQMPLDGGEQHVMVQKEVPVQNTYDYKYPKGVINPIERRVVKRVVNIDTLFRTNYDKTKSTNFVWAMPAPINNVVSLKVVATQIPNTMYAFSSAKENNVFTVRMYNVNDGSGGVYDASYVVVIPDGNYTPTAFQTAVNNYFFNDEVGGNGGGLSMLTCVINPFTAKTVIRARDSALDGGPGPYPYDPSSNYYSPDMSFRLDFNLENAPSVTYPKPPFYGVAITPNTRKANLPKTKTEYRRPLYKNAGWMMGFRKDIYDVSYSNAYIDTIANPSEPIEYYAYVESEACFANSTQQYVFVDIDDFNRNYTSDSIIASTTGPNYLGNNILAMIPISAATVSAESGAALSLDTVCKEREYFGPVRIEKLQIRVLDRYGDVVDLLGNDLMITLELNTLY